MILWSLQNLRIAHHFPKEYLEEFTSSANGSYHVAQALKEGVTAIKATLLSVLLQVGGAGSSFPAEEFYFILFFYCRVSDNSANSAHWISIWIFPKGTKMGPGGIGRGRP